MGTKYAVARFRQDRPIGRGDLPEPKDATAFSFLDDVRAGHTSRTFFTS